MDNTAWTTILPNYKNKVKFNYTTYNKIIKLIERIANGNISVNIIK